MTDMPTWAPQWCPIFGVVFLSEFMEAGELTPRDPMAWGGPGVARQWLTADRRLDKR